MFWIFVVAINSIGAGIIFGHWRANKIWTKKLWQQVEQLIQKSDPLALRQRIENLQHINSNLIKHIHKLEQERNDMIIELISFKEPRNKSTMN